MYVDDAVDGFLRLTAAAGFDGTIDFASGAPVSVNDVVRTMARVLDVEVTVSHNGHTEEYIQFRSGDRTMRDRVGFTPTGGFEDGIRRLHEFLRHESASVSERALHNTCRSRRHDSQVTASSVLLPLYRAEVLERVAASRGAHARSGLRRRMMFDGRHASGADGRVHDRVARAAGKCRFLLCATGISAVCRRLVRYLCSSPCWTYASA